ncbi:DinB family protein [Streptomyces goshikiensis]
MPGRSAGSPGRTRTAPPGSSGTSRAARTGTCPSSPGSPRCTWSRAGRRVSAARRTPRTPATGTRPPRRPPSGARTPGAAVLLGYLDAVHDRVEGYLAAAPAGDLARTAPSPTLGTAESVEVRLAAQLADSLAHVGQLGLLPD